MKLGRLIDVLLMPGAKDRRVPARAHASSLRRSIYAFGLDEGLVGDFNTYLVLMRGRAFAEVGVPDRFDGVESITWVARRMYQCGIPINRVFRPTDQQSTELKRGLCVLRLVQLESFYVPSPKLDAIVAHESNARFWMSPRVTAKRLRRWEREGLGAFEQILVDGVRA